MNCHNHKLWTFTERSFVLILLMNCAGAAVSASFGQSIQTNLTDRNLSVDLSNKGISILDSHDVPDHPGCCLTLTKTVNKPTAYNGEDITYNITLSNPCHDRGAPCYTNVTLWDVLPPAVELVSVYPEPSSCLVSATQIWDIGTMCPGDEFVASIVVRIPIVEVKYDMEQGVSGVGFVNVHNDYDTHQGPESITNCAYVKADLIEILKSCASTKIIDPGTEIKRREFGSGIYESTELTRIRTENKSIRSATSLIALYQPTYFSLPQNRSFTYATMWSEKSKSINTITGTRFIEEYSFSARSRRTGI